MADNKEPNPDEAAEPQPKKSKKGLIMGGGIVSLIASAYALTLVALPQAPRDLPFEGPFVTQLTNNEVQVNLKGDSAKRYMVMTLRSSYEGYDEAYAGERVQDPLFEAKLRDVLIGLGRRKTREELEDKLGEETFKEEIRASVAPLLFPVHVGNADDHRRPHGESGLLPGSSSVNATMRGGFHGHMLRVDALKQTIALDAGPVTTFNGSEEDLLVENERGLVVYVDVSGLDPEFVGDVAVGTFGHLREILFSKFLVQ